MTALGKHEQKCEQKVRQPKYLEEGSNFAAIFIHKSFADVV